MKVRGLAKVIQLVNGRVHALRQKGTIHFCFLKERKIEKRYRNTVKMT